MLDTELIKSCLKYDESVKGLVWIADHGRSKKGTRAGFLHQASGFWKITLCGVPYNEARVVWALTYGEQPPAQLKHKNGLVNDNRPENLYPLERIETRRVTHTELLHLIHYDPLTGEFTWRNPLSNRVKPGSKIQCRSRKYRVVRILNVLYECQVIAWFYMTGEWPSPTVDHIDRDPSNNRWDNLRLATHAQNSWNTSDRGNQTGFRGVARNGKGFRAAVGCDGKTYRLGTFDTPEEAHEAYKKKCQELHGEFSIYAANDPQIKIYGT